jgi:outer membrane biosynthesis protein TonB
MEIEIKLGVTPELASLLTAVVSAFAQNRVTAEVTATEAPATVAEKPKKSEKMKDLAKETSKPKSVKETEPAREVEPAKTADTPETAETTKASAPDRQLTEEDIRTAIHATRAKFEGSDYLNNTESEGYKKYHRQLTQQFKSIAISLGFEKPSLIDADHRQQFVDECGQLRLSEDGKEIVTNIPF